MLPAKGETGAAVGLSVVVCVTVVVVFVRVVELVVVDAVSAVKIWSPYSNAITPLKGSESTQNAIESIRACRINQKGRRERAGGPATSVRMLCVCAPLLPPLFFPFFKKKIKKDA